ncbi:hypothetical protein GCM10011374_30200 [Kocuria dechangensis]|uniref:Uncharacterized protein n=1 Tax=Kocuria dechangensis TaxID=1176249 RepID=A0A917H269_9MICC|nr:hypothetical protein [Kocuria dechangensis]GGG64526.1 hypothetical protein GCM10011374_30200 [Kocuria dechangensis]
MTETQAPSWTTSPAWRAARAVYSTTDTRTGAELRAAAANAVQWGNRRMPTMRRQAIGPSYLPAKAEDPALVLAVAVEQLGRQAALALRQRVAPKPHRLVLEDDPLPRVTATGKQIRTVSPTWVEPVSGYGADLVLGRMESSYTRQVEGPRSRAATTVREFYRRAPGPARSAAKTVKVSSRRRKGTGPDTNAAAVTRVSGHRTM